MAPHRVDLGDEGDAELVRDLGGGDGRPQASAPASYDDDVVLDRLQRYIPSGTVSGPFYRVG
ncbi:MAG TPA: hypothetical protein VGR13_07570, partial [Actinomycetota bacterium]|nr:hypothetical protein [Actinomycetota bacterium]